MKYEVEPYSRVIDEMRLLYPAHWLEIAKDRDIIPLDMDYAKYEMLEQMNLLHVVTARDEGKLVGYINFVVTPHLHHMSTVMATQDFMYLKPSYRKGWIGINFLRFADESLKARGVRKVFQESTLRCEFGPVLKYLGYEPSASIYSKVL